MLVRFGSNIQGSDAATEDSDQLGNPAFDIAMLHTSLVPHRETVLKLLWRKPVAGNSSLPLLFACGSQLFHVEQLISAAIHSPQNSVKQISGGGRRAFLFVDAEASSRFFLLGDS